MAIGLPMSSQRRILGCDRTSRKTPRTEMAVRKKIVFRLKKGNMMHINKKWAVAFSVVVLACSAYAGSVKESVAQNDTTAQTTKTDSAGAKKAPAVEAKKKENEYEKLMKDSGTVVKGLFTVRHIKDKWYFEVPDSLIGRYLLAVTRFASVPQGFGVFSGEKVNDETVYFEKRDEKTMLLRAFVRTQEANSNDRIYQTLKQSTADPIVAAFPVIGKNPHPGMNLIDVTSFFVRDNNVVGINKRIATKAKLSGQQTDRTFVDTIKTYPINVEVMTTRTYGATIGTSRASGTGSLTLALNTSIVVLPKEPMRRRLWDERVGYFTTPLTLFSDRQHKSQRELFISRYRLVPKDVKRYLRGELVEPVKQIVYYIDPATPKKWVPYLIKGINDWNVAFEAAGFKNAIVGKEWPNDPTMSLDDARYCVLRYLPSEAENAYGPHVKDPRSGEIIESHICWYHNVMNLLTKWYMTQCGPLDRRAQQMDFDEKLMGQLIRFVSSHEVGHTLGLRHNMGASHATPVEKLRDKAWVEKHGHTASIMDYARFNYVAQPEDHIGEQGLFPRINDYDKWAIKWGYQYRPEFKDEFEEKERLMTETTAILSQNPRLWFGGEGKNEDPRAQTEDLGDDNVKASDYGVKNLKRVVAGLPVWTQQTNGRYDHLREMYANVRQQFTRYMRHVMKNLGGRYLNNLPGRAPYEIAPAKKQKEALEYLGRQVFDAPLWLYPMAITEKTGIDVQGELNTLQKSVLDVTMTAAMLNTIYNDSQRSAKAYRLPDYLNDLFAQVWTSANAADEMKNITRRALQRQYVENLNRLLNPTEKDKAGRSAAAYNSDALLYVAAHLDKLENYLKGQMSAASGIQALHIKDLLQQIQLIKDRRTKVN